MYYGIAGGKVWDSDKATYVLDAPVQLVQHLYNGNSLLGESGFALWLANNGLPLGKYALLAGVKADKLAEVLSKYSASFTSIEAIYPAAEREGWPIQAAEAQALLANPSADPSAAAPMLSALAQLRGRGETARDLAQKVLANAAQWSGLYAYLTGQQQRMYAEVSALADAAVVLAYKVVYQMPPGMGG